MLRLLDLFCGAGGAAVGYSRAGFDVLGVDINAQPSYPFRSVQADALTFPLIGFDAIHASPPCQAYSALRTALAGRQYPDLIGPVRLRLQALDVPWVIENVPGAPLIEPVMLCGSMFGLGATDARGTYRQLRRHRLFESSVPISAPSSCAHDGREVIGVYGGGRTERPARNARRGGYQGTSAEKRTAMGVDWMNRDDLAQAIPPAYTEHIGRQLREAIT